MTRRPREGRAAVNRDEILKMEAGEWPTCTPTCTRCGDELPEEEASDPDTDEDGDVICSDCWRERFMDLCVRCDETVMKTELEAKPGELIAIWMDVGDDDLLPGYYRVKEWPFYADGMIEGFFFQGALEQVAALDARGREVVKEGPWCASAPLCEDCRTRIESRLLPVLPGLVEIRARGERRGA
jgi:hypothetical protein